jgi:hypothetical protein
VLTGFDTCRHGRPPFFRIHRRAFRTMTRGRRDGTGEGVANADRLVWMLSPVPPEKTDRFTDPPPDVTAEMKWTG